MTIIRKLLDALNMNNWNEKSEKETAIFPSTKEPGREFFTAKESDYSFPQDADNCTVPTVNASVPLAKDKSSVSDSSELDAVAKIVRDSAAPCLQTLECADPNDVEPTEENLQCESERQDTGAAEIVIDLEAQDELCDSEDTEEPEEPQPYRSAKMLIQGLHIYFIDVAREIVQQQAIQRIPLMREYHLSEHDLNQIITELHQAQIIDNDGTVLMKPEELEKFIDIYEPNLFLCKNTVFDKDIFMCIGEILYENGVENTYNTMPSDELIDYLNIFETLGIIKYDSELNTYILLKSKDEFVKICNSIPEYFGSKEFDTANAKYENADYDAMSGIEFENYIAFVLFKNGFIHIKTTPASSDHGIDLTAEKDGITYAIQCKCYSSNVGNAAVQQAYSGRGIYKKDIAVVITNQYFTAQAKEEAASVGVKLWDRDKLKQLIDSTET